MYFVKSPDNVFWKFQRLLKINGNFVSIWLPLISNNDIDYICVCVCAHIRSKLLKKSHFSFSVVVVLQPVSTPQPVITPQSVQLQLLQQLLVHQAQMIPELAQPSIDASMLTQQLQDLAQQILGSSAVETLDPEARQPEHSAEQAFDKARSLIDCYSKFLVGGKACKVGGI